MAANRLGEFLRAHREAAQAARHHGGTSRRRTPGLRREEVAERAAISSDYYTRLEQGRERNPSPQVVDALAAALNLSPVETGYLRSLVGPALATPIPTETAVNEFLLLAMQSWESGPAYIVNHRSDILALNESAREIFDQFEVSDNILRMLFLDPAAKQLWADWDAFATFFVGGIRRIMGGAIDDDPATVALIADVSAKSAAFAAMWERQAMNVPDRKAKTFRSQNLGEVRLDFELLKAFDTPNQVLVVHRMPEHARQAYS